MYNVILYNVLLYSILLYSMSSTAFLVHHFTAQHFLHTGVTYICIYIYIHIIGHQHPEVYRVGLGKKRGARATSRFTYCVLVNRELESFLTGNRLPLLNAISVQKFSVQRFTVQRFNIQHFTVHYFQYSISCTAFYCTAFPLHHFLRWPSMGCDLVFVFFLLGVCLLLFFCVFCCPLVSTSIFSYLQCL